MENTDRLTKEQRALVEAVRAQVVSLWGSEEAARQYTARADAGNLVAAPVRLLTTLDSVAPAVKP